jgi:hypothetical protein
MEFLRRFAPYSQGSLCVSCVTGRGEMGVFFLFILSRYVQEKWGEGYFC